MPPVARLGDSAPAFERIGSPNGGFSC